MILWWVYDMVQLDWLCVVSSLPILVKKNNQYRLHNDKWPAIAFRDWYELYYINWFHIKTKEEFEKITNDWYSVEELLAIEDSDIRAIAYEYFDKSKFDKLDKKILDESIDWKWNKMQVVEFDLKNIWKSRYYIWICPSTWKTHYIWTDETTCEKAKSKSFWIIEVEWINEF